MLYKHLAVPLIHPRTVVQVSLLVIGIIDWVIIMNLDPEGVARGRLRFVYVAIIPWQPVNQIYYSRQCRMLFVTVMHSVLGNKTNQNGLCLVEG